MVVKLPQKKKWPQTNQGDLLGAIFATRNIDLRSPGLLTLSQRTRYVGQRNSGNLTEVRAIEYYRGRYWIASDRMFYMDAALTTLTEDSGTIPTVPISDLCLWKTSLLALFATSGARVHKLEGSTPGTWTTPWSTSDFTGSTDTSIAHPIEPNITNGNLLVGDVQTLKKIDTSGVVTSAFAIPSGMKIDWIRRGTNVNYIGFSAFTYSGDSYQSASNGGIAVWDGLDTTISYNYIIPLNCRQALSAIVDDEGILWIITSDGQLQKFNGNGFTTQAELPPFRDYLLRRSWGGTATIGFDCPKVLQRGMKIINGQIHVAVSAQSTTQIMKPEFQSGVWVYDEENKAFYLRYTPSNSNTITDFGQSFFTTTPGALFPLIEYNQGETSPVDTTGGILLTGGRLYPNTIAGTALRTIVSVTSGTNRGQFSTVKIESQNVTDDDVAIWCKFHGVNTSEDKILFKYRISKRDPFVITNSAATWMSTTIFRSTDTKIANAQIGDEITVLTGNGAGCTAHITNIEPNFPDTGTYQITLDEAITGVSANDTAWIMFDSWKKIPVSITLSDTLGYKRIPISTGNSTWIEIKGELRGEGGVVAIEELSLVNNKNTPIT